MSNQELIKTVILEYKNPNGPKKLGTSIKTAGSKEVISQLEERFKHLETNEHVSKSRIFGVGSDGANILFVTHGKHGYHIDGPFPLDHLTMERVLRAIISVGAKGSSYSAANLAVAFGSASPLSKDVVAIFYRCLTDELSPRAKMLYDQWKLLFSEVCGYSVFSANDKIEALGKRLGIANAKAAPLLFSIHTYFAIFIKILAAEICQSLSPLPLSIVKKVAGAPTSKLFKDELQNLEDGGIWFKAGISNFLEGDIFSWYLNEWSVEMFSALKALVVKLDDFDPFTLSVDPDESQDLLKNLYEDLVPGPVRHDLGEYYTPDWLVDLTLRETGYIGHPDARVLDPACGSGSFLIAAINRIRRWFSANRFTCGYGESELVVKILENVKGFDLNPLAVMASRVNYLSHAENSACTLYPFGGSIFTR